MADAAHASIIIAVGDEVLGGFILDTNSHWLAGRVREAGFPALRIEVVADHGEAIVAAVRRAVAEPGCDRVLVSGGLGPTPDDRTLAALAVALDRPLEVDERAEAHVRGIVERMHRAGWTESPEISEANRRMTVVPRGAIVLENRRGMAPCLAYPLPGPDGAPAPVERAGPGSEAESGAGERWLIVLPGVPRELQTLVDEEVVPRFFTGGTVRAVGEQRYRNAIEAEVFEPMRILEREFPDVAVGSYPQSETRELVMRVHGPDRERVEAALRRLRELRPPAPGG